MNNNLEKIKTYIGFAIKSRKIKFGVDDILKLKTCDLILISENLTESGLNKLIGYAIKNDIPNIELKTEEFQFLIQNDKIKAIAILDNNLADAIKKNLTNS